MSRQKTLSIIVPAFNEEASIKQTIDSLCLLSREIECEIIAVDDGSTDNTRAILQDFQEIVLLHNPRNKGYGASLKAGLRKARGKYVLTIDADGQHTLDAARALIAHMGEYDMVVGERGPESEAGVVRKVGKMFVRYVVNSLGRTNIYDFNSGLRLFCTETALKYIHLFPNGFSFSTTITAAFLHEGYRVRYVPVEVRQRKGQSTVSLGDGFRTVLLAVRLYMLFAPLRIFIPASSVLLGGGLINLILDLTRRNVQDITVLVILSGFLTCFFGLIVDQMAHIRREMKL